MFDACPPFQIDGNFGGTAGIAEMLMQSRTGTIELLPALPKAFPHGLGQKGCGPAADSRSIWRGKDGQLASLVLRSLRGEKIKLRYGKTTLDLDTKPGQTMGVRRQLCRVEIALSPIGAFACLTAGRQRNRQLGKLQLVAVTQRIITNFYTAKRILAALQMMIKRHESHLRRAGNRRAESRHARARTVSECCRPPLHILHGRQRVAVRAVVAVGARPVEASPSSFMVTR